MLKRYPITAYIFTKRADGIKLIKDKARFVEKRMGRRYYQFKKFGQTKPIPLDYIDSNNTVYCYSDNRDTLTPIKIDFEKIKEGKKGITTIDEDMRFWISQEFREADSKYLGQPTFWEKYGTIIAPLIILIGAGVFFWMLNSSMAKTLAGMKQTASILANAATGVKGGGWVSG